jgi:thiol-disulfide isomerase/thioredoxin
MKNYIISILAAIVLIYTGCDVIEEPYFTEFAIPETEKKVLLEDYTGHLCVYCAGAAVEAEDLKEAYGDNLVVVAVHAGFFAWPVPNDSLFKDDFRTDAGETWNDFFNVEGNPIGMVNRKEFSDGYLVAPDKWNSEISNALLEPVEARLEIENSWNEASRTLTTTVSTRFLEELQGPMNLLVLITQDSIVGGQKNNEPEVGDTPEIEHYVFMHMMRGSLNGDWGERVTNDNPITAGKEYTKTYSKVFPEEMIPEHCHVVAFVFNDQTKTVLQAEEEHVIQDEPTE